MVDDGESIQTVPAKAEPASKLCMPRQKQSPERAARGVFGVARSRCVLTLRGPGYWDTTRIQATDPPPPEMSTGAPVCHMDRPWTGVADLAWQAPRLCRGETHYSNTTVRFVPSASSDAVSVSSTSPWRTVTW